jgi:hypothetical protein
VGPRAVLDANLLKKIYKFVLVKKGRAVNVGELCKVQITAATWVVPRSTVMSAAYSRYTEYWSHNLKSTVSST